MFLPSTLLQFSTCHHRGFLASSSVQYYPSAKLHHTERPCLLDCGTCCYGWWCFPCLGCSIASDMDECCLCGPSVAMRTMYRTRYNIKGSLSEERYRSTEGAGDLLNSDGTREVNKKI
ncbi:hypothetical protein J4Q44_G00130880 [Coregonus suidteri]|uniref:Uncharacterized protein n=1 Tax=Coregonus suidteri TaxID=861788 RepID=A0AAN8LSW2_9TELE